VGKRRAGPDGGLLIVETSVFTRQVASLLDAESYRLLQVELVRNPEAGALIRGSGGLRKIRWARRGGGKRGGLRVIYYWHPPKGILLLLVAYPKTELDVLTAAQLRALRRLIEEEFQ
jgi:mRNA-degrading endonuclease RelE of RelBE toxin-antitoxin system